MGNKAAPVGRSWWRMPARRSGPIVVSDDIIRGMWRVSTTRTLSIRLAASSCFCSSKSMRRPLPCSLFVLILALIPFTHADPLTIPFEDCFDESDSLAQKFLVDTVYAQVLDNEEWGNYLNLTVLGTSPQEIVGLPNGSSSLCAFFHLFVPRLPRSSIFSNAFHDLVRAHAPRLVE